MAAGLRAGKPTGIVPFFGDQRFWANQAVKQGWGLRLTLDKDVLAQGMRELLENQQIRQKAWHIGGEIQQEDGVGVALAWLQKEEVYARSWTSREYFQVVVNDGQGAQRDAQTGRRIYAYQATPSMEFSQAIRPLNHDTV